MDRLALPAKSTNPAPVRIEPSEQAALRALIIQIVRSEFSGDISTEFWVGAARRVADKIIKIL